MKDAIKALVEMTEVYDGDYYGQKPLNYRNITV